jgi:TolB-like protein
MAGEIFISYRRADEAWARLLHAQLRAEGVEAWYDTQIGAGQDWRVATAKALQDSRIFVLLFSAAAAQSEDIAKELAAAIFSKKLVVPVRIEDIQPTGAFLYELASRNWVNAFENTEAKLAELARSLAKLVKSGNADESVIPFDRNAGAKPPARKVPRAPVFIAAAALVMAAAVAALFWLIPRPASSPPQPMATRVAVLPFDTLDSKDATRVFGKALAEQIIATLNDVQVQTVSREDAATLSGAGRDAAAVKLGAEFILNGSVQNGEKGLRVTVHLDHVSTHATVWTASYDQNGAQAIEFQSQVAATATEVVQGALRARRDDPEEMDDAALGIVLKMIAGIHIQTPEAYLEFRDLARLLIGRAPRYSQAYSSLAVVSGLLMGSAPAGDIAQLRSDLKKAAAQALALNPKNGAAYHALALLVPGDRWAEREAAYRKGLAVDPKQAALNSFLAGVLSSVGRQQEALALNMNARLLVPQSPPVNAGLAMAQVEAGHVAEGIFTINRAGKIWPSHATVWLVRFYILANFGHVDEARAMLDSEQNIPVSLESKSIAARRAYLDALRLNTPASKTTAAGAIRSAMAAGDLSAADGMQMFAGLGDVDSAFTVATTLFSRKNGKPPTGSTTPLFRAITSNMRRDPRFMPLAAQAGLVDYWTTTGKWPDFCAEPGLPYDCRAAAKALVSPGR